MELKSSKHTIFLLFIILSPSLFISSTFSSTNPNYNNNNYNNYSTFVKKACNTTTYPTLCLKTCLPKASKIACDSRKLATTALTTTLSAAKAAASTVAKLSHQNNLGKYEANVVRDCIENMGDSIDELKQSIEQMNEIVIGSSSKNSSNNNKNNNSISSDVRFKVSNIQTWMSGAITNENTCMDEIKEGNNNSNKVSLCVKNVIRKCVLSVVKLTSVSLSLCNHLQYQLIKD